MAHKHTFHVRDIKCIGVRHFSNVMPEHSYDFSRYFYKNTFKAKIILIIRTISEKRMLFRRLLLKVFCTWASRGFKLKSFSRMIFITLFEG